MAAFALTAVTAGPGFAYTVAPVADGGTLAGVVRFIGKSRPSEPVVMSWGGGVCDEPRSSALVLGPDGSVVGSVILVEGVTRGKASTLDVVLEGRRCAFTPRVTATMVGARTRVRNADPVLHSARGLQGTTTVFHVAIPGKEQEVDITRRLNRPGVIRVLADSRPHMAAWMVVHDSPYLAVTDARGTFRIEGIPPGSYRVTMWHPGFRRRGTDREGRPLYEEPHTTVKSVTIAPRGMATVAFDLR